MNIHMIWAQDRNHAIGRSGTLPWHFSEDLKNFKKLTTGKTIIMGRKTWDSLPKKPLPDRRNIVISSTNQENVESYISIEECIDSLAGDKEVSDVYIVGGMSIYKFFYEHADTLFITFIDDSYKDTDTFFPIDLDQIKADFKLEFQNKMNDILSFSKWNRK